MVRTVVSKTTNGSSSLPSLGARVHSGGGIGRHVSFRL